MLLPFAAWLEAQVDDSGPELPGEATVAAFRLETTTAILRFVDRKLDAGAPTDWIGNACAGRADYSAWPGRRREAG